MNRAYFATAALAAAVAAAAVLLDGTETRAGRAAEIVRAKLESGRSPEEVAARLVERFGLTEAQAAELVRRSVGRTDRLPESRFDERVGVLVASSDVDRVQSALAAAFCQPLAGEDEHAACLTKQAEWLSTKVCRASDGVERGRAGMFMTTPTFRERAVEALRALDPAPVVDVVREATPEKMIAAAVARNLRGCEE